MTAYGTSRGSSKAPVAGIILTGLAIAAGTMLHLIPQTDLVPGMTDEPISVPRDAIPSLHTDKHIGQVWDALSVYGALLDGKCTATGRYCRGGRELYLCKVPGIDVIGGAFLENGVLITGFGTTVKRWQRTIARDGYQICK